jgi:hypothetical protein
MFLFHDIITLSLFLIITLYLFRLWFIQYTDQATGQTTQDTGLIPRSGKHI